MNFLSQKYMNDCIDYMSHHEGTLDIAYSEYCKNQGLDPNSDESVLTASRNGIAWADYLICRDTEILSAPHWRLIQFLIKTEKSDYFENYHEGNQKPKLTKEECDEIMRGPNPHIFIKAIYCLNETLFDHGAVKIEEYDPELIARALNSDPHNKELRKLAPDDTLLSVFSDDDGATIAVDYDLGPAGCIQIASIRINRQLSLKLSISKNIQWNDDEDRKYNLECIEELTNYARSFLSNARKKKFQ